MADSGIEADRSRSGSSVRGASIVSTPVLTPRGRSVPPPTPARSISRGSPDDVPVTAKDSRDLLDRSRSPYRATPFANLTPDEREELRASLLQLYAMQQIAMKQAQGKASRAVRRVDERLALTM